MRAIQENTVSTVSSVGKQLQLDRAVTSAAAGARSPPTVLTQNA
jgi:hypothetical protein